MIYVVGFTGPVNGMVPIQEGLFIAKIVSLDSKHLHTGGVEFHHGDCVGADDEADKLVRKFCPAWKIVIHPPTNEKLRAYCHMREGNATEVLPAKKFLLRDSDIAFVCNELIATPETEKEFRRSGTWATVRRARIRKRKLYIILPSGKIQND